MQLLKIFAFVALFCCHVASAQAQQPVPADTTTIFMIGDSTMANKKLDRENQERGWGQLLPFFLQGAVKVDNHAVNGQSSKSFIDEGRWEKVRSQLRPGDYVIIQFGHNDEKIKNPARYTVPGATFDDNLRKFVIESKAAGAVPVLMNSIVRRHFEKTDSGTMALRDTHGDYLLSPRNVALEQGVAFIDMNALTHSLVQKLGPEVSKELFVWFPAGAYEFCPEGKKDNTHLNVTGAIIVSKLAVTALAAQIPGLRRFIAPEIYNLH